MPLAPGARFGTHEIVSRIGAGGMGEVWRARDTRLDREVALKVLPAATLQDETARARLLREARLASKLNHPHVCTIHEVGEAEGQTFIVMELVAGEPLGTRLAGGALPADQVLLYGQQVADALAHAHERGVVHRDLKSANVVITPEGRAKVLDFGLAKRLAGEQPSEATTATHDTLTSPGTLAGTLAYMAPEQLRGRPADARSDIWALGVMLYEMATGRRPFQGPTGFALSSAILNEPPPPLPQATSVELRTVIERCLAKEPGQRYQRAGEVRAALETAQSGGTLPLRRLAPSSPSRRLWLTGAAALLLIAAVLAALDVGGLRHRLLGGAAPSRIDSLAVLPLENLSGDPEQDYLADGIHEALITDLARLTGLRKVIARSSMMRYHKTDKSLAQIAADLGVDAIVTGSVLRSGSRVRVTAQLVRAATEENLWADRYERELSDVLSLQNEVVAAITRPIRLQLAPQDRARLAKARSVDPEAYEAYLKGKFYLNKRTPEGFERGLAYLKHAVDRDPADPLAWAGLALGYTEIGHQADPEALTRAKAAALKASELGGSLAEVEHSLAAVSLLQDWDWEGAGLGFERALALNPSFADAHAYYGWYLQLVGRDEDSVAQMERAGELDPLTPLWSAWLGWMQWEYGRLDSAIAAAQKSLELDPAFPDGLYVLGAVRAEQGRWADAIAAHETLATTSADWRWALGRTYAQAGRSADARKIVAVLEKRPTPLDYWGLAEISVALGDKDAAFRWLDAGFDSRFTFLPWLKREVSFEPLDDDPRLDALLRRMKVPPGALTRPVRHKGA